MVVSCRLRGRAAHCPTLRDDETRVGSPPHQRSRPQALGGFALAQTRALIEGCDCENGCPTCVGPIGETGPLAKTVALRLLQHLVPLAEAIPGRGSLAAAPALADDVPF